MEGVNPLAPQGFFSGTHFPGLTLSRAAARFVCCVMLAALLAPDAEAATRTWTNAVGGTWSVGGNWSGGIPAGAGDTADFSTLDLTADIYISLNGNQSVDGMTFADSNTASGGNWFVQGNTLTLTGAGEITVGAMAPGKLADIYSQLAGSVGLTKTGVGELRLGPSAKTYTGATLIKNGSISYWNNDNILPTGTTVILGDVATEGKLYLGKPGETRNQQLAGLASTGLGGSVVGTSVNNVTLTLALTGGQSYVFGGVLGGPGSNENKLSLTLSGSGKLTLSGNNTHEGGTQVGSGTILVVQHTNALGAVSSGTSVANDGQLQVDGSLTMAAEPLSLAGDYTDGSGALRVISGNSTGFGNIDLTAIATINCEAGTSLRLDGKVGGGSGGIIKTGSGTLELLGTGTDGYSKATTVNAGTLKLGGVGNNWNTPLGRPTSGVDGTFVNSPGVLDLNGWTIRSSDGGEGLTLNGAGTLINSSATAATYPGAITLAGASSIVANNGNIILSAGINTAGFGLTLGGAAAAGSTVSSVISGTGALTKEGSGTWTLSVANTYSGATTVNDGRLLLNNTTSTCGGSPITVNNGGYLGGCGFTGTGLVTLNAGGGLAPGTNSVGMLTVGSDTANANLTANGMIYEWEWDGNAGTNDLVHVKGNLTFDPGAYTVKLVNLGGASQPVEATKYPLFTYSGADPAQPTWTIDHGTSGWTATVGYDAVAKTVYITGIREWGGLVIIVL